MKASKLFRKGDFRVASYRKHKDGSLEITIVTRDGRRGRFKVRNLYKKDEEILEDEEV